MLKLIIHLRFDSRQLAIKMIIILTQCFPPSVGGIENLLENLSSKIKNTTVIGLETGVKDNVVIPENLNLLQKKTYGKTIIYIFKLS